MENATAIQVTKIYVGCVDYPFQKLTCYLIRPENPKSDDNDDRQSE